MKLKQLETWYSPNPNILIHQNLSYILSLRKIVFVRRWHKIEAQSNDYELQYQMPTVKDSESIKRIN